MVSQEYDQASSSNSEIKHGLQNCSGSEFELEFSGAERSDSKQSSYQQKKSLKNVLIMPTNYHCAY